MFRLSDDLKEERARALKARDDVRHSTLGRSMLKADDFKNVLVIMGKQTIGSGAWSRVFDEETQRMVLDRDMGPLPCPAWMVKHRYEQRITETKERSVKSCECVL